jgi:hypothetical protein
MVLLAAAIQSVAAVSIENELYTVSVNAPDGSFSVAHKPSGKVFFAGGKLSGTGGTAKTVEMADKTFGNGKGIEVNYPNGNKETLALCPGLPFVLCGGSQRNGGTEPVVLNHIPTISGSVDLGKPLSAIKTLGTGGLLDPARNPGSYAFLAVVDPETRSGVVGGWITHDRGSGVVFSPVTGDVVRIQAQIDYGRLRIKPAQDAAMETFAVGYFEDARLGLEAYADAIAKVYAVKLPAHQPGYCTWYMEKHGGACDEKSLVELSEYAAKNLKPFGFGFIQIDDGWQEGIGGNGPKKNFTTHTPKGSYPGGMKATADNIKRLGLVPGIWFMPFAGNYKDPYFLDHQDWFAKDPEGKPYETAWGGTCLDMTRPGALENMKNIVKRIAHEWGYGVFKMDGYWTGSATKQIYVNNGYKEDGIGDAEFSNPDKTNIEVLRDGTKAVRAAAGPDVFLLGCCVSQNMRSFGGTFGLLDAMRVGPDTGAGHIGAPHASRLWFLNGRVWWNDPDCVSVRAGTALEQARLNATFTTIAGDLFYNSDWMPDFPPERLDILRRCIPAHGLFSRPVDVFENEPARIWHLADTRGAVRRDIVALYNWGKDPLTVECAASRIGLPPASEYVAFDFWANRFVPPFKDVVRADLPPGGACRILSVRPVSQNPQLLGTSRHVTQGMIDVTDEKWDAGSTTLSAAGKVVGNDPYELRIIVPVGEKSWRVKGAGVSADDQAAGTKIEFKQDGPKVRVLISSPSSREVKWQVQFEPARIEANMPQQVNNLKATAEYRQIILSWDDNDADSYRVTRDDGVVSSSRSARFTDMKFPRNKPIRYSVEALGWNGSVSKAASVEVTPMAELKIPPAPPLPTVYLDEGNAAIKQNGWGKAGFNKSVMGKALSVNGKKYEKGIGVHAKSLVVCRVPAGAARFVAITGIDDSQRKDERASIAFEVYGDVKEMGEQPVLLGQSPVLSSQTIRKWAFDVELNTRFKELRLVVTDGDDGINADHGDWVDAGFIVPTSK